MDADSTNTDYRFDADSPTDGTTKIWTHTSAGAAGLTGVTKSATEWLGAVSGLTVASAAVAILALNAF